MQIKYDQEKAFIGHEFRKSLIEMEYGITDKPSTSVNSMSNAILEWIRQVIRNLVPNFNISTQTYVDKNDPWTSILDAAAFVILSTTNRKNCYSPGQLIFSRDMIILIKHRVDW